MIILIPKENTNSYELKGNISELFYFLLKLAFSHGKKPVVCN